MAEVLLASRLRERGIDARVESAGTSALVGYPADPIAQELLRARGLDLSRHRARQVTADLVRGFDLVLAMEPEHQRVIEAIDPSARGRVHRIGRVGGFDIPDPYRQGRDSFERTLQLIERGLDGIAKIFWSTR